MNEYTTDSHLNANCTRIAEELEAHANGRAYTDENGSTIILDSEEEPTDEMEYRGLYDFIESADNVEVTRTLQGEYLGARLFFRIDNNNLVTVSTLNSLVESKHNVDSCSKWIDDDVVEQLDEAILELVQAAK